MMKWTACFLLLSVALYVGASKDNPDNADAALDNIAITTIAAPKPQQSPFISCKDVPSSISGVYLIQINNNNEPFEVFCEQEHFGGGWIVVQHRFDGSVDFYRNWNEYREGFGNLEHEFWLGLQKIHQITTARGHEILFELKDFNGTHVFARYDEFQIGSEKEQYSLKTLGKYNGTASDAMEVNKGMKFSTKDRDNDQAVFDCAQGREGAWWYNACTNVNLNGPYKVYSNSQVGSLKSMFWYLFKGRNLDLSFSRMMIRELE
ncbi:angiopoietin-related protein 1-like [Anopheles albimanus]|uniref:Fibrinogen C-terminal domain-containing protein n=1 Tax=Anopheles albimanus TaxID=7167 RepID=A0A8W7JBW9_ANOAL|nr:angiopoietin-related protein 1-like [Anopheles albimanus]